MDNKIAPCPYPGCGNNTCSIVEVPPNLWIMCDSCMAEGPSRPTEAEAIAAWNAVAEKVAWHDRLVEIGRAHV